MFDKVQHYWAIEKQKIVQERNTAETKEKRDELTRKLDYMNKVEMAVIVSEEDDENEKFRKQGLDISMHRQKMKAVTPEGLDIEDRFKDPEDPLQLVFVCAMWLTGFDVENLSTLYLDKPMKGHALMQAIARANRVYPNKPCGMIVDYVNVFKYMKRALAEYATGGGDSEFPVKNIDKLITLIDGAIQEADGFLLGLGVDIGLIIEESSTLDRLDKLRDAYNIIVANDEAKDKFKVILNTLMNLYESSRPEIFEKNWNNEKFSPLAYLYGLFCHTIDDEKINRARLRMAQVLDTSVISQKAKDNDPDFVIHQGKVIDLSKIDVETLKNEIHAAQYKAVEIDDLKKFIEQILQQMINRNCTRQKFSERFKNIIDRYNAGGSENEDYYDQLVKLIEELKAEDKRAEVEGLSEEELEIFDMLIAGKKLTKDEEQKVKLSAKNLFKKLTAEKSELLVVDWYKDEQPLAKVKTAIETSLNADLPPSYDIDTFKSKTNMLLTHFIDMAVQGYGWAQAG
jgi:type I restriction enzyme R subunit